MNPSEIDETGIAPCPKQPRTLWQLLIARLAPLYDARGRCPKCDYLLYGLTETRCPECGRPFNFEELGVSPEEINFRKPDSSKLAAES